MNRRKIGTVAAILSAAVIEAIWANANSAFGEKAGDAIVDGVHLYTPKNYVAPKDWAYTRGKDGKFTYAIRPWREGEKQERRLVMDCANAENVAKVTHLATGREIAAQTDAEKRLVLTVPEDLKFDAIADAFRLELK